MSSENEDFTGSHQLLELLIPLANYTELLQNSDFWKHFSIIKDEHFQSKIRSQIVQYYTCQNCNHRLRRFPNSSFICYNCQQCTEEISDLLNQPAKLDCLNCFKSYRIEAFSGSGCNHLCAYCISKEQLKTRDSCKICLNKFHHENSASPCIYCNQVKFYNELNELRCGCIFCDICFMEVRRLKRCLKCIGINILTSELHEFSKKKNQICFICEEDKPIMMENGGQNTYEFVQKDCCFLDVCIACHKAKTETFCVGCESTMK